MATRLPTKLQPKRFDTHVHSAASPDADMLPQEAIHAAAHQGLGLIFTEHIDFHPTGGTDFCADLSRYPHDYAPLRSDAVLLGVEIGLTAPAYEKNAAVAAKDWDYVLGSVHFTPDGAADLFFTKTFPPPLHAQHLQHILEMVRLNPFFDALAHLDYISRYTTLPEKNLFYAEFAATYDAIFAECIARGKVLELNTRRWPDATAQQNLFTLFSRYREMGGRHATIGSDAHTVQQVGHMHAQAFQLLQEAGLTPVYFRERKMQIMQ